MRRYFTTAEALARGITPSALRWGEQHGRWQRIRQGVWREGDAKPDRIDDAVAAVLNSNGVARGRLAGLMHGLDSVGAVGARGDRPTRRRPLSPERVVMINGIRCANGLQTLVDLAPTLTDLTWEHALESALRKGVTSIVELEEDLPGLARSRTAGIDRIRRVVELRPVGALPTESLLETLMVQLARRVPGLPDPVRQLEITNAHGRFVARVDLAWPPLGLFLELDGEHHKNQPLYDANRETAVIAATGWLCGRFTWSEVVHVPISTARRLAELAEQACRPPVVA